MKLKQRISIFKTYLWFKVHAPAGYNKTKDAKECDKKILKGVFGR